jgi:hypothetical protein
LPRVAGSRGMLGIGRVECGHLFWPRLVRLSSLVLAREADEYLVEQWKLAVGEE